MRAFRRPRYADVAATLALVIAMGGTAFAAASTAPPNSVDTAALQNHAVTAPKLAAEAVTQDKVAPESITSSNVVDGSLRLADFSGADLSGSIALHLLAHGCGYFTLSVSGAKVGQAGLLTFRGTANPPLGLVFGPLRVVSPGQVVASGCNLTSHAMSFAKLPVRVVTLG